VCNRVYVYVNICSFVGVCFCVGRECVRVCGERCDFVSMCVRIFTRAGSCMGMFVEDILKMKTSSRRHMSGRHTHTHTHVFTKTSSCLRVCKCLLVRVCVYMCERVCACLRVCECLFVRVSVCVCREKERECVCVWKKVCIRAYACANVCSLV